MPDAAPVPDSPAAIAGRARAAARMLARACTASKRAAILGLAEILDGARTRVAEANAEDLARAEQKGLPRNLIDRLRFGEAKIDARIAALRAIAAVPDPVGTVLREETVGSGLLAARIRVPIGVILMVYEARPHVTFNAGALCLTAGNAAILRGGSEARSCNTLIADLWRRALDGAGLPADAVQVITGDHAQVAGLLERTDDIDLVIPRGGRGLIEAVVEKSTIPVLKHYTGVCHVYLDTGCDLATGLDIALDSKCLMPAVCNAAETLLIHADHKPQLPAIAAALAAQGVALRGCERTRAAVPEAEAVSEDDYRQEYLDLVYSVRVVDDLDDAIEHINTYGSHHTDAIVTPDAGRGQYFVDGVDSAVTLVNASTMFCDGATLGMGAEIGIATDKVHARGPMGAEELTSYQHVIRGDGTVMGPRRHSEREI